MVSGESRVALETLGTLLGVARRAVVTLVSLSPRQAVVAGRSFLSFLTLSAGLARQAWHTFVSRHVFEVVRSVYGESRVTPVSGRSGQARISGLPFLAVVSFLADVEVSRFSLATSQTREAFYAVGATVARVSVITRVSLEAYATRQALWSGVALAARQASRPIVTGFALLAFNGARR